MDERAAKEYLLKHDVRFQELFNAHQEFERKLVEMTEKPFLSPDEQIQEVVIKKKKLALKDQMQVLIEQQRTHGAVN